MSVTFRNWKFGVIESVCVTLLVGLSVDYPLHVASAYAAASSNLENDNYGGGGGEEDEKEKEEDKDKESFENDRSSSFSSPAILTAKDQRRASRALQAIRSVGPSVIGGALTTASAATFLFTGCVIVFFTTFGAFVIVTLCLSVLSSAFVLTAVLAVVGPV